MTGPADVGDLDRLFRAGVEAAGRTLAEGRPLWPFGLGLTVDGVVVAAQLTVAEARPTAEQVVVLVRQALAERREDLRAAVVVADARLDGAPALRLELEERLGEAVVVTVPYLPGPVMQQPTRAAGQHAVF